ncbi:UNVERIFIED_CONTAM: putative lipid phosphate phosphatase 3, chloroplastic [Sesamum angustifolium]|uniref:Lipid phosphate phosphatase 3, chloroplastic n=1 Tax=Sesamum angustifolium TaxID=2727405 RepID=A0AAW2RMC0_9LAMI
MPWPDFGSNSCFDNFGGSFWSQWHFLFTFGSGIDVNHDSMRKNTSAGTGDWFSQLDFPLIEFENHQSEMWESQPGTHTVRSHGVRVATTHMHDWLILIVLGLILIVLNVIHPFYRFVGKDMMSDFKYPFKSSTVPPWAVPIYAIILPLIVFLLFYLRRRDVYDLHHTILGLLFSVLITAVLTDAIKDAVGRPRPDFFWRCFPDGKDAYDQWGNVVCHGDKSVIRQGHFPVASFKQENLNLFHYFQCKRFLPVQYFELFIKSEFKYWAFAGLGFLSLYLAGKIKAFDGKGHVAKLCVVLLPLVVASLIGISRVNDYRHHWQDVVAGGLLGLIVATLCYLQFFPPPYHAEGWRTHAYLHMMEESRTNANNARTSALEVEIQPNQRNGNSMRASDISCLQLTS